MAAKKKPRKAELKLVEPATKLPKLTLKEQSDLKECMLKMALELERSKRYIEQIDHIELKNSLAKMEFKKHKNKLEAWNMEFNKKLRKYRLSIDAVDIDVETRIVKLSTAYLAAQELEKKQMEKIK